MIIIRIVVTRTIKVKILENTVYSTTLTLLVSWRWNYSGGALTLIQVHSVGACVSYVWQSLLDITEQLLMGHQSGSQWTHSCQAASAQLTTRKPCLHTIGGPSKRQPMNSLVSSCLGSTWLSYKPPKCSSWCKRIR